MTNFLPLSLKFLNITDENISSSKANIEISQPFYCYVCDSHTLFYEFSVDNSVEIYEEPKFFVILWILSASKHPHKIVKSVDLI